MGFLSASIAYTRYRIMDEVPETLWSEITDRLKKKGFREIENTAQERGFGWVCFDEMLDSEWVTAPPQKADFLAFGLRLDTRRLPAAVLNKHFKIALKEKMKQFAEQGTNFITRNQKKELRDQIKAKLMTRTMPIPAVFDVVWDTREGLVFLASNREKIRELFTDLFLQTFELHLEPLTPYFTAQRMLPPRQAEMLDDLEPTGFGA
ncbi:MAG: recombination-associated protein RdgC [Desulfonatronovibrionaceae bacterium]